MSTTPSNRPRRNVKRKRYDEYEDEADVSDDEDRVPAKQARVLAPSPQIIGRCGSAPPPGWTAQASQGQIVFPDVTKTTMADAWGDPNKKGIRLVYPNLVSGGGSFQGIFIPDNAITSSTDTDLHQHLAAVRDSMLSKQSNHQLTEATGEAATALAMRKRFPNARMRWGMHVHGGAGIDQIWVEPSATKPTYYIVEAKGVGAGLTYKTFGPPDEIKQQMSLGWVLDNLARMARSKEKTHRIAREILTAMGLTELVGQKNSPYYPNYGRASKSYYACGFDPALKRAEMYGVVVNAIWNPSGLSYVVTSIDDYGSILPFSDAIKQAV